MNPTNLKRTFIHELGHYTARTLNLELYNKGAGVLKIWLKEEYVDNMFDYWGGTEPRKPANHVNDGLIINKPEYAGAILYGCIFQNLYESRDSNIQFNECFCQEPDKHNGIRAHGKMDYSNFNRYLGQKTWPAITNYVEQEYIALLRQNINHFKTLFDLEVLEHIKKPSKLMYVDMEKLEVSIRPFLNSHKKFYSDFMREVDERIKHLR